MHYRPFSSTLTTTTTTTITLVTTHSLYLPPSSPLSPHIIQYSPPRCLTKLFLPYLRLSTPPPFSPDYLIYNHMFLPIILLPTTILYWPISFLSPPTLLFPAFLVPLLLYLPTPDPTTFLPPLLSHQAPNTLVPSTPTHPNRAPWTSALKDKCGKF